MSDFEWDLSDRWMSNKGRGPYRMRILSVSNGMIRAERWLVKGPQQKTRFDVSVKFFTSSSSGWKLERAP